MTCPNTPLFRHVKGIYGPDMAYALYEYLNAHGWANADINIDNGMIIQGDQIIGPLEQIIDEIRYTKITEGLNGETIANALRNIGTPEALALLEKVPKSNTAVRLDPEDVTDRASAERAILRHALAATVQQPKNRSLLKIATSRLRDYAGKDGATFLRRLMMDGVFQTRVRRLKRGGLWDASIKEVAEQVGMTVERVGEIMRLQDQEQGVPSSRVERPLTIQERTIKEAIRTLQNQIDHHAGRPEGQKDVKRINRLVEQLIQAKDEETIIRVAAEAAEQMAMAQAAIENGVENNNLTLETLDHAYNIAAAYEPFLGLADQLLRRNYRLKQAVGQEVHDQILSTNSLANAIQREYVENAIPIVIDKLLPFEHRTTVEMRNEIANDRSDPSKPTGRYLYENKQRYKTEEEFDAAKQAYVESEMERRKGELETRKRKFLSEKLRQNLTGDISRSRAFIVAIQYSGDDVLAMAKQMTDKANDGVRKDYLLWEDQLHTLLHELQALKGNPDDPLKLYDEIIELVDGKRTNYLVSEYLYSKYEQDKAAFYKEINTIEDPYERLKAIREWMHQHHEQKYTDEWYQLIRSIMGDLEQTKEFQEVDMQISDFISSFRMENGQVDSAAMTEADLHHLATLYEQRDELRTPMTSQQRNLLEFHANFQPNDAFRQESERRKQTLTPEEYVKWEESQKFTASNGDRRLFGVWQEIVPKDEAKYRNDRYQGPNQLRRDIYINEQYAKLMALPKDSPIRKFYDFAVATQERMDKGRPMGMRLGYRLPTVRKSVTELARDESKTRGEKFAYVKGEWIRQHDDVDYGVVSENMDGSLQRRVPLFYTTPVALEEGQRGVPIEDISFDIASLLAKNSWQSLKYQHMTRILPEMEAIKRILAQRKTQERDGGGRLLNRKSGERRMMEGRDTNAYELLLNFMDKEVFGINKIDETVGGIHAESWDKLLAYNSVLLLGGNLRNAVVNMSQGQIALLLEGYSGAMFSKKAMKRAYSRYMAELGNGAIIGDMGVVDKRSKTNRLIEWMDGMNDFYGPRHNHMHTSRFQRITRNSSAMFAVISLPEHFIHATGMYAVMDDVLMRNAKGEYIDAAGNAVPRSKALRLTDAMNWKDGSMEMNPHATHMEFLGRNMEVNDHSMFQVTQRIRWANEKMHGAYSNQNRGEIYRHVWGRVVMQMKGWLIPLWDRRWRGATRAVDNIKGREQRDIGFDYQGQQSFEGSYVSLVNFTINLVRDLKQLGLAMSIKENRMALTELEAANIRRAILEIGAIFGTIALGSMLLKLAGEADDEMEESALYFAAYIFVRLRSELQFYIDPTEGLKLMNDPAAMTTTINNMVKLIYQTTNITEKYDSTWREGQYKIQKHLIGLTPYLNHATTLKHSKDVVQYYQF
jgi:hypothetical protein